jgi:hypothetical protein
MSLSAATNRLIIRRLTRQRKAYCHLLRVSYGTETCGVSAGALKFHVRASAWPRDRAIISPAENIIVIHWESHLVRSPCAAAGVAAFAGKTWDVEYQSAWVCDVYKSRRLFSKICQGLSLGMRLSPL